MTHHGRTTRNAVAAVAVTLMLTAFSLAQYSETVLHTFTGGSDGAVGGPFFVSDSAGNLYGATYAGGNKSTGCQVYTGNIGCGVVFELIKHADGTWKEKVLYTFSGGKDGGVPSSVILDSAGNLFGTAMVGGDDKPKICQARSNYPAGCGVVFKLTRTAHGPWKQTVLHTFTGGSDGAGPWSSLILDSSGNLYGTGSYGGNKPPACKPYGCGVVFKLTPRAHGPWKEAVLYAFPEVSAGIAPYASVTFDSVGNLYGTTVVGGDKSVKCDGIPGCGVVFQLAPTKEGPWTETVLHAFMGGADGGWPLANVILDSAGNVYGTTWGGGDTNDCPPDGLLPGCGVVFELAQGTWKESELYTFTGKSDGAFAANPVIFDSSGNLYGTTRTGGDFGGTCTNRYGCGVAFELTPAGPPWNESVLYAFPGGADGEVPQGNIVFDSAGNIFDTTYGGGDGSECLGGGGYDGCGVVFELTP